MDRLRVRWQQVRGAAVLARVGRADRIEEEAGPRAADQPLRFQREAGTLSGGQRDAIARPGERGGHSGARGGEGTLQPCRAEH